MSTRTITTLLVANRGEIARRVMRTASEMGLRTIAVYTAADAASPHVTDADESVLLPEGGYLSIDAIIAAATASGADAIHPGYGFLSENAGFARAVADNGIVWVGPGPEAIEAMGDKLAAKRLAIEAGVPTLPMAEDPADAASVGYPLLVKAAAGGGGKGMRIVERADDLVESVEAAQREALGGFGDATVFLERYVARSRHVEIQIFGDAHGNVIHLGERECSVQRRHQKVVEESPSPVVDAAMRERMGAAAVALAKRLGYRSAGTVEFLVDDASREFWFLEVNTRLQVEHPVTEEVTGLDLVREQLRVAMGEPLSITQDELTLTGHAIEVRLYAEDPAGGFLPSTGTLEGFRPAPAPAVRWDSGVVEDSVVGTGFDPMLAKVIAHAPTRREAALRLALALERTHVAGVITNRDLLVATLRHTAFLDGDTTTDFFERHHPDRTRVLDDTALRRAAVAAALWIQGCNRAAAKVQRQLRTGWRNGRMPAERVVFAHGDRELDVRYRSRRDGAFVLEGPLGEGLAHVHAWAWDLIDAEVDGHRVRGPVTRAGDLVVVHDGRGDVVLRELPRFVLPGSTGPEGGLDAPMPGKVLDVRVGVGDHVEGGQVLLILEAMKMEHRITAPHAGVVSELRVRIGDQVERGATLLAIESTKEA